MTGGAGFIGSALSRRLAESGHEVVASDNINDYYPAALKLARLGHNGIARPGDGEKVASSLLPGLSFVRLSLEDKDGMERLFGEEKFDKVVNLAAQAGVRYSIDHPYEYLRSNVDGFMVLLECCRNFGVGHLVFASSSSVYGRECKVPFSEDARTDSPVSLYAATKKADEAMAYAYCSLFGIRMTGLRYFTVYGPWGRPDMAPFLFADAIMEGKPLKIFNGGHLMRDFTYVDDVVEATKRIAEDAVAVSAHTNSGRGCGSSGSACGSGSGYGIYNVGCSSPVRLMDFVAEMEKAFGKEAEKVYLPMQQGDVYETYADVSRLERDYGFRPRVSLEEGMERFARWYLSAENPLRKE